MFTAYCTGRTTQQDHTSYSRSEQLMGSVFHIEAVVAANELEKAKKAVKDAFVEIARIENLISSWIDSSETAAINRNAGIRPVVVSDELLQLIIRSKKVSVLTEGIFDISYASLDKVWKFDGSVIEVPDTATIIASVKLIGYENIIVDPEKKTVFLKEKGMKIGFGAIGKGYAANRSKLKLMQAGIEGGVVNAGGDLIAWGKQKNGEDWTIGIADPQKKESALSWMTINDLAVVTSGNYEKFVELNEKRYSHIIDPRTGWPAESLNSVTIICPDAELADALATAVFIMGAEDGISFIDNLKDVECLIVDGNDQLHYSRNIQLEYDR